MSHLLAARIRAAALKKQTLLTAAVVVITWCLSLSTAVAEDKPAGNIPPRPSTYFSDPAHLISEGTGDQINFALEQFERKTSNQVVVAIFPDLPEGEALEDFTQRTAEAWKVGQKDRNNGAILFIFVKPHQMRIEVGYGLEGALPDITAHQIIQNEITPAFKTGDFTTGIIRGVNSIFEAIQGEYKGTGWIAGEQPGGGGKEELSPLGWLPILFFGFILFLFFLMLIRNRKGYTYGPLGGARGAAIFGLPFLGGSGGKDDDGGFFGGGGGGGFGGFGGGGGFMGGGGGFGGGGASGGW